ncbi:MAG: alpha/beta fold hydrolase [Candidatus Taylorbacteria bacterium]
MSHDFQAIIIPGNGDSEPNENWYPYVKNELEKMGIATVNEKFPDAMLARSAYWLPFIKELGADENTILIGHSSGAIASMRYAEKNKILGSVLVGAYHTNLDNEMEKKSGYFDAPWNWEAIKKNQKWIVQFASRDDAFIPIHEARFVHENLNSEYYEYADQGHFSHDKERTEFPELIHAVGAKL